MKCTRTLVMAAMLSFGLMTLDGAGGPVLADSPKTTAPEQIVKGDVLMTEGESYIVKDVTGHEVRLHVNQETKLDGKLKVGDKIVARVTPEGHALSITLQIPESGAAPVVPTAPAAPSRPGIPSAPAH